MYKIGIEKKIETILISFDESKIITKNKEYLTENLSEIYREKDKKIAFIFNN